APTILENEETRAVALVLDASAARDDHRDPVVLSLRHEHVAYLGLRIVELFDEEDPVGRDRFAEPAGRHLRDVLALRKALLVLARLALRPWRDEECDHRDHQRDRRSEGQHRPDPRDEALSAGEPEDHFGVAKRAGA